MSSCQLIVRALIFLSRTMQHEESKGGVYTHTKGAVVIAFEIYQDCPIASLEKKVILVQKRSRFGFLDNGFKGGVPHSDVTVSDLNQNQGNEPSLVGRFLLLAHSIFEIGSRYKPRVREDLGSNRHFYEQM